MVARPMPTCVDTLVETPPTSNLSPKTENRKPL